MNELRRRLPVGAEVQPHGGVHFRVWAPERNTVSVVLEEPGPSTTHSLVAEGATGYWSCLVPSARPGNRYRFQLDKRDQLFPDPVSRFQPDGPHGPSLIVDPSAFHWTDTDWPGVRLHGQVIYEMHLGTFTDEGTWNAAQAQLAELARIGITMLEIMPVADFAGTFGWGYDGVCFFAPHRLYGSPDDVRRFVDAAHQLGLGVILDVVYNHVGPEGNYLSEFAAEYFSSIHKTDWGPAINYDGADSGPVREYILANAGYWIEEFHFDGLRLDATQDIHDDSPEHILAAIGRQVRESAQGRSTVIVAENEPQQVNLIRPVAEGGYGLDAIWNDDFHHAAHVSLTGRAEAYFSDYLGTPQEFVSMARRGFLYQGQLYSWQNKRRGSVTTGIAQQGFVVYLQNHDQVANSGYGKRPCQLGHNGRYRALTALLLLGPQTPMLFQGQEFASSSPFLFFADHEPGLRRLVADGRQEFLAQFPSLAQPDMQKKLADPGDPRTWQQCKLDFSERQSHAASYALHCDLLRLRREDPVFSEQNAGGLDGAVLGSTAWVLRFAGENGDDRLLLVNLGRDLDLTPVSEPLLAPEPGRSWCVLWSSEDPRYGGDGAAARDSEDGWHIPGEAAMVMKLD